MLNAGLFTSRRDDWETPQQLFDQFTQEFGPFDLDPCASEQNAKCPRFFTEADDGLAQPWAPHKVFLNPPYGREIGKWVKKAWEESQAGALVVCLLPARTDTAWFHNYVLRADGLRFLRGRLHFNGRGPAPFPSMIAVFYSRKEERDAD